jgi:hypothetical protein
MVAVAQLVRASDCGSEGRGFETHQSPGHPALAGFFFWAYVGRRFSAHVNYGKAFVNMPLLATCLPIYRYFWNND